ncbi:MAG TPA: Gfo/Idh/MocA family oxidoreductase [Gemmatimonadales bacterium]|jgi:predicted dehydrogenase|nr:Gfo/Idh/MocA family oxidoreductase [Gemmatimonadales bacterium]
MDRPESHETSRREFLQATAAGIGITSLNPLPHRRSAAPPHLRSAPINTVRIGVVGVGGQGSVHVENLLTLDGVELSALCDIVPEKVSTWQQKIVALGRPKPAAYTRGPRDFERLAAEADLDLVLTATPWEWHVPVVLAALRNGKHAASEVPLAYTVDDCWALVEAAEKYRKHCVMLENCCYDRLELLAFHLARLGLLGELLHAECGYNHDLREVKFSSEGEGLWRRAHATRRNGNLYPTHGLGPVAQAMSINRGNQFDYLVSMSTPSRGLQLWQQEHLAADDPRRSERYLLGDINLTLLRTLRGQTIYLTHDTNLPRPYSRKYVLQGTRGLVEGYPRRVYVEGKSQAAHRWDPVERWFESHDHPLWKSEAVRTASAGHGGMDWLEDWRLISCLREGLPTDQNVYDGAAWSVVGPLTEWSVKNGSRPIRVPDFTRGRWKTTEPLGIIAG